MCALISAHDLERLPWPTEAYRALPSITELLHNIQQLTRYKIRYTRYKIRYI